MNKQDYFSRIPKDIQRIIFLKTKPKDLDILCRSNTEISKLCFDKNLLDEYFKAHNLDYNLQFKTNYFKMRDIVYTDSSVLIAHMIDRISRMNQFKKNWENLMLDILRFYMLSPDVTDENAIQILNLLHSSGEFALTQKTIAKLANIALRSDRDLLFDWIISNYFINYNLLMKEILHIDDITVDSNGKAIDKILDTIFTQNIYINWEDAIREAIQNYNFNFIDTILSMGLIDKNTVLKYLIKQRDSLAYSLSQDVYHDQNNTYMMILMDLSELIDKLNI